MQQTDTEVIIIGAGMTGLSTAWNLYKQGISFQIVDREPEFPPLFRAEKIEKYQAGLLRKFGLLEFRRPYGPKIDTVRRYKYGRLLTIGKEEQYGIRYHETVNEVRQQLSMLQPVVQAKVINISLSEDKQRVTLDDGREFTSRLVVLATGPTSALFKILGLTLAEQPNYYSMSFGFDVEPVDGGNFDFLGFNYYINPYQYKIDYITFFRVGEIMRVNMFSHLQPKNILIQHIKKHPEQELQRLFPGIFDYTGPFKVSSTVEIVPTTFYRTKNLEQPGLVVMADGFQGVNPATGTGLDKALTDVDVLCSKYVTGWLETPGMSFSKIQNFYNDETKKYVDGKSWKSWQMYHNLAFGTSLFWRLKRSNFVNQTMMRFSHK